MVEQFVINDRRGQKKEPRQDTEIIRPQAGMTIDPKVDTANWLGEVCYPIVIMNVATGPNTPPQTMVVGRAVGERSDGNVFIADYFFAPIFDEGFDWTKQARKRLDTFLGCGCNATIPCATHKLYLPQWQQQDIMRIQNVSAAPMPHALEVLVMAERAKQSRLVIRGRG